MSERNKKHWVKPPTKIYDYNYDYGEGYYKPMVDHLRRKDQGIKEKPPGATTFAERVAVFCPGCHGRHKPGEPHYKPRERDVSPERASHVKKTSPIDEFDSRSFDSDSPKRERRSFPNLSDWFDKDENGKHAPNSNSKFKMQDWINSNNDLRSRRNRNAFFDNDEDEFKKNTSSHRFDDETKRKDDSYRTTHEFQSHIESGSQLPNRSYKYVSDIEDSSTVEVKKKTTSHKGFY